jgi:Periplasmic copper-binding protein (NosD)
MFRLRFIAIVTAALFLSASAFAGTTYAVGTCQPKLPFYTTISQAVSSVPPGSTIEVCPGNYPEQVLITQPLTLKGVESADSYAPVVVVPSGGLVNPVSDPFFGTVYYQILVQTTGPVNITNLAVDAIANTFVEGFLAGIFYQDASGTVSEVSARNQLNVGDSIGILAETTAPAAQTVTVQNSVVRGFDGNGIEGVTGCCGAGLLTENIMGNTISATLGTNGIAVVGATATAQSNVINTANGFLLNSSIMLATANNISANGTAVYVYFGTNSVKNNRIDAGGQTGVSLNGPGGTSVVGNTIVNSLTAVNGCGANPASGDYVFGNTITDAAVGVQMPSGNTTTPNKFYVATMAVEACP